MSSCHPAPILVWCLLLAAGGAACSSASEAAQGPEIQSGGAGSDAAGAGLVSAGGSLAGETASFAISATHPPNSAIPAIVVMNGAGA